MVACMANIKPGALVKFKSGFEPFQRQYDHRNPGIVLCVGNTGWSGGNSAQVMWSDGSETTEHAGYLQCVGNGIQEKINEVG